MPRVTEAHRRARRDEIAAAAVRVLRRRGVGSTSIAQIVEESGLSAGAIYANFENKSELARFIAQRMLDWRIDLLGEAPHDGTVRAPLDVLGLLLGTMDEQAPPLPVILQFWAEATMDADLHLVLTAKMDALRTAFEQAVLPWAAQRAGVDAEALAARTAVTMLVLAQGYLAHAGLLGWTTPEEYLAGIDGMLER